MDKGKLKKIPFMVNAPRQLMRVFDVKKRRIHVRPACQEYAVGIIHG
jgi:hypothetical protein